MYEIYYTEEVYGIVRIEADSEEEAIDEFTGNFDEYSDNFKSNSDIQICHLLVT